MKYFVSLVLTIGLISYSLPLILESRRNPGGKNREKDHAGGG